MGFSLRIRFIFIFRTLLRLMLIFKKSNRLLSTFLSLDSRLQTELRIVQSQRKDLNRFLSLFTQRGKHECYMSLPFAIEKEIKSSKGFAIFCLNFFLQETDSLVLNLIFSELLNQRLLSAKLALLLNRKLTLCLGSISRVQMQFKLPISFPAPGFLVAMTRKKYARK